MRLCRRCKQEKPAEEFRDPYWCIGCRREWHREYNKTPSRRAYNRRYYEKLKKRGYFKEYARRPEVKQKRANQVQEQMKNPELRIKHLARWTARRAKREGKIIEQPCAQCGASPTHAHHPDYNKSLLIVWLCGQCHRQLHVDIRTNATKEGK